MGKDEIWELKPEESGKTGEKKEVPELLSIEEKEKDVQPQEEGVHVARQEASSVSDADKPQFIEPEKKKPDIKMPELKGEPGKKFERTRPTDFVRSPDKSRLLTVGLAVIFLFLAGSVALLTLPFFGIEQIPDDLPVLKDIIDFYRNLPIFPE